MAITNLKKAARTAVSSDGKTRSTVARVLARIEVSGEAATRELAAQFDGGHGDVRLAKYFPDERFELQAGEIA